MEFGIFIELLNLYSIQPKSGIYYDIIPKSFMLLIVQKEQIQQDVYISDG